MKKDSIKNQRIKYKHITALRDLGGIFNFRGIRIKKGLIYRSSDLSKFSKEEGEEFAKAFNIGHVIDLRAPDEVSFYPDVECDAFIYHHFPVLNNEQNPVVNRHTRSKLITETVRDYGSGYNYMKNFYAVLATSEQAHEYYSKVFDVLLSNTEGKAIDYHCKQGKDRTGMCSALILSALGVDKESIILDYLAYNTFAKTKSMLVSILVFIRFYRFKVCKSLYYVQMAKRTFIDIFFKTIDKEYGSMKDFLHNQLHLDDEKIAKLKEMYLD